jgi:hypothetical protein
MDNLTRTLCEFISPEANHLLTERPDRPDAPGDFGWFCREHALVTRKVLHAIGHEVDIVRGHVSIFLGGGKGFTTVTSGTDEHYWCRSTEYPLLDLSLNLKHFAGAPFRLGTILRPGTNGEFTIVVVPDERQHAPPDDAKYIYYTPLDVTASIADPMALLVSELISLHIIDLVSGNTKSMQTQTQEDAMGLLIAKYGDRFPTHGG